LLRVKDRAGFVLFSEQSVKQKTSDPIMTVIGGGFLFMGGPGFVLILMSAFGA